MQETTKKVANMRDPSPEAKAKAEKTSKNCPLMHALVYLDENMVQVPGSEPATNAIN